MPFYRKPVNFTPLHTIALKKSIKNGLHHAIFTSRFDRYVGDWQSDLKQGKGFFHTYKGRLYEGDWLNGFRHGFGLLSQRQQNGIFRLEYRGDWVRGKPEGIGWWWYENGDVYFGYWKRGQRHGYGKMYYANGTFYVGYWGGGYKQGLGMFVQENGNRYEGHWSHDKKNGIGRFYHMHTGQLQKGCWADDICVSSKMSDIIIRQFCDFSTEYPIPKVENKENHACTTIKGLFQPQRWDSFIYDGSGRPTSKEILHLYECSLGKQSMINKASRNGEGVRIAPGP